ncbi:MAG: hypothetical protein K6U74_00100 [Firmicutes bacterium]|nr:hypothetical protein [Bacillota bacterium]
MGWFKDTFLDDFLGFDDSGGLTSVFDGTSIEKNWLKPINDFFNPPIPENPGGQQDVNRSILATTSGGTQDIPVVYGNRRVGSKRVFHGVSGTSNEFYWRVMVLCEGQISAIPNVYLDGVISTDAKFGSTVTIEKYLGTDTQAASAALVAAFPGRWTTAHQGKGLAYIVVRLTFDPAIYNSVPEITADIMGKLVYDPRSALTAYSPNPALCIRDYLTNTRYGKGLASVPDAEIITAANVCDSQIQSYSGGANINMFECHAVVSTAQTIKQNIDQLLSSCRGMLPFTGGSYKLIIERDEASVMNLNADNLIGGWSINGGSKRSRLNRAKARFINPSKKWEEDFAVTDSPAFRTLDNNLLLENDFSFPFETNYYRALYHAEVALKRSRQGLTVGVLASPEAFKIEIGNIVDITHSTPGWTGKKFRVTNISLLVNGLFGLSLMEHEPTVYDRNVPVEAPTPSDTNLPDPRVVAEPTIINAYSGESEIIYGQDGSLISVIRVVVPVSPSLYVVGTEVDYKLSSETLWKPAGYIGQRTETTTKISPVVDSALYDIRARYINAMGFYSPYYTLTSHQVVGKTTPPPPVTNFFTDRQPDGTRTSKWDYLTPPVDLDGFLIRYQLGTNQTWATMTPLHTGSLKTSPYEFNQLAAGTYTIAIKAVDTSGNESSAVYSNVTLGDPRLAGIITDRYPRNEGWPGIKTSCWIDNTGSLIANNTSTWGTGPTTWTAFNKWAMSPVTPIVYEHTVIDLGNAVPFTPLITVTGTGTQTITVATSLDNVTYTAFAAPATVTARYVKVKIEMSGTGTLIIDSMIIYISGQVKDEYIENANVTVTGDRINYLDVGDFRVLPVKSYAVINYANLAFQNLTPVANENWQWTVVEKNITTGVRFNVTKNGALANLPGTARCDFYIKGL